GMADLHRAAVLEVPALVIDDAVGRREDRFADLALVVDAIVEAAAARAAVIAPRAERRGDARIGLGVRERRAAQPLAGLVEPALRLVERHEPPVRFCRLALADGGVEQAGRTVRRAAFQHVDLRCTGRKAGKGLAERL